MKKILSITVTFSIVLSLVPLLSHAQKLPDWVLEMKKPVVDYPLLTQKFNDYWKDKMKDEDDEEAEAAISFEKEEEFSIKEEYGWLRFYNHQYFEMIGLRMQRNPQYNSALNRTSSAVAPTGQWTVAGPVDHPQDVYNTWSGVPYGVGRVNQLAFSGMHANVMYAVAPAGLFISTDTGTTWHATATDFMDYHSFRSIAVDPTNDSIIYLGYGDYTLSFGYIYDTGVMKSVDFGNSFTSLTNGMDSVVINTIQINPLNTNHIVAGGIGGIWKSMDAGLSWQHSYVMIDTLSMGYAVYDIKFKPNSADTLYATTDTLFLMSTDGGSTWNPGFNNFQFGVSNAKQLLLGVTPAAPDYVYIGTQQDFGNIYKSTNGGATFTATKQNAPPGLIGYDTQLGSYGQGAYDFTFYADPFDSLKIYMGSISVYGSNDGGITWNTPYSQWYQNAAQYNLHPDQHHIIKSPLLPDMLWIANDGGIYAKHDSDSAYTAKQGNLPVTMAFHFDADNFYDSTFAIGTQDNGASFSPGNGSFNGYKGGDVYARIYCAYNNSAAIYTAGSGFGSGSSNIDIHNPPASYPIGLPESDISEPMSLTPVAPLTAFLANTHVWETNNMNGNPVTWRKIIDNTSNAYFLAANHCLADSTIFYALRSDGYLLRTFNALDNQPVFDSVLLPFLTGFSPGLITVPNNPDVIYYCENQVYMSTDKGLTWTNITGTLNPLFGFREIVADPFANDGSVYLLATNKVYYKNDTTAWMDYSNQLPNVTFINDIAIKKYNSQVSKVWVSVYGRSVWSSPTYQSLLTGVKENVVVNDQIQVYPVPASNYINVSTTAKNLKIDNIIIYNEQGQQVSTTRSAMHKTKLSLNVAPLANGIYFMEINTTQGIVMKRIVVNK